MASKCRLKLLCVAWCCFGALPVWAQSVPVYLSGYSSSRDVTVRHDADRLTVRWPMADQEYGEVVLDLTPGKPLIESMGVATRPDQRAQTLLRDVEPVTFLTVGERRAPKGRPPTMSVFNVFFDKPADRPYQSYVSRLKPKSARVLADDKRTAIAVEDLTIGPFAGELRLTFYANSRLVHVEAVVSTREDRRAIIYDAGILGEWAGWRSIAWMDTEGQMQRVAADPRAPDRPLAVRHRAIIAESGNGSVAIFPPPHQYHFPRDWTDNLKFVWMGRNHRGLTQQFGLGVRQVEDGGRRYEPWFNAPPETQQRLGIFYLLSRSRADNALRETLRYTNGDRFKPLPGHIVFTSHYHMAVGVQAMEGKHSANDEYARVFKDMGVQAVQIADFHGDGHQRDPGPLRLPEMEAMFKECRRLSNDKFLFIPAEELSGILGIEEPGKHPGHWMSLFPKPVYFTQVRSPGQPFVELHPQYGTVYHAGNRQDMMELLKREGGLAWTSHPRIKASSWCPDIYRNEDFYLADFWLGATWKAMPADLWFSKLGAYPLQLLSDMANWGQRKYMLGEVDVFKLDHTHELYGHMNVNYLRLDRLPRYDDSWQPVLDVLRGGKFFVTTGEVLIRDFTVGGKQSGETLVLAEDGRAEVRATLEWTFPLHSVEIVSGDGKGLYLESSLLNNTTSFGSRTLTAKPNLRGRKWVRFEVWDVAANGAFTQPVWLTQIGDATLFQHP